MKKYHVHTTLSPKHHALLKKHTERNETQQKTLELAQETLDNSPSHGTVLSQKEKLWLELSQVDTNCLIQKDCMKMLMETVDLERFRKYVAEQKPIQYAVEYYNRKPLAESSLIEVIEGMVNSATMSNWFDTVDYTDKGDHYLMKITHSLGLNNSKMMEITNESVFITYGVKTETKISEKTLFMKIFKNQ
jgi:hypothetical protein